MVGILGADFILVPDVTPRLHKLPDSTNGITLDALKTDNCVCQQLDR